MKPLKQFLPAALALALSCIPVFADTNESDDDIIGSSDWKSNVTLVPQIQLTNLGGKAEAEIENDDGVLKSELKLEPTGLLDGTYKVYVATLSGSTPTYIGSFTVSSSSNSDDENVGETDDSGDSETEVVFGSSDNPLPADLKLTEITSVFVYNSADQLLLRGDLGGVIFIQAQVFAKPGVQYQMAAAKLTINARKSASSLKGNMVFTGRNLPPNATMSVVADGIPVGSITSDKKGRFNIVKVWNPGKGAKSSVLNSLDPLKLKKLSLYRNGVEVLSITK